MKHLLTIITLASLVVLAGCQATQVPETNINETADTNTSAVVEEVKDNLFDESGFVIEQESDEIVNPAELNDEALTWLDGNDIEVDNASFEVIDQYFAKDSNIVYYKTSYRDDDNNLQSIIQVIEDADPDTFFVLTSDYPHLVADDDTLYILVQGRVYTAIEEINIDTFQLLDDDLIIGEDNEHYLLPSGWTEHHFVVKKNEFVHIDDMFARDTQNVYIVSAYGGAYSVLEDADPTTFKVLEHGYAYDDNAAYLPHILYEGRVMNRIVGIDQDSFRILASRMAIDKNNIYNNGQMFDDFNVDVATFTYSGISEFFYDKNYPYIFRANTGIRLEDTDVDSFEPISGYGTGVGIWWKDRNGVYVGILDEINELAGEYGFDYGKLDVDPDTFSNLVSEDCDDVEDVEGCEEYDRFYSYKDKNGSYGFPSSKIIFHTEGFIPQQILEQ